MIELLPMKHRNQSGFTVVELLVVIAIVGLIAGITFRSINGARTKSRDTKRVSDIALVQNALATYYYATGTFPGSGSENRWQNQAGGSPDQCPPATNEYSLWTTTGVFDTAFQNKYLKNLPSDPTPKNCYTYSTLASTTWRCSKTKSPLTADFNPGNYAYHMTFAAEANLDSQRYPYLYDTGTSALVLDHRCVFGPLR